MKRRQERQRVYDRKVYAETNSWRKKIGEVLACERCGAEVARTHSMQRFCEPCSHHIQLARRWKRKGSTIACEGCSADLVVGNGKRHYCDDCRKTSVRAVNYLRRRAKEDPAYRLKLRMKSRMRRVLSCGKNGRTFASVFGYTAEQLKRHLERQFHEGMSWENYGTIWHVDHIVPLASFKLETVDDAEFKAAFALTNLRPLWAEDNIEKRDRRLYLL